MELATKNQLIQIALYENCDIETKYKAIRELQERYIPEEIRADILYRLGVGISIETVAKENGLTSLQVVDFLRSTHYKGKHMDTWDIGYKQTLQACGRQLNPYEKYLRDMKGA